MVDTTLYKRIMGRYATGVMVLTVRQDDDFHAVTVNSVASVSLEPTLLLVCLEKNARSHELVHQAQSFALTILSDAQMELGKKFAYERNARNKPRQHSAHFISERGELLLQDSLGYFECRVTAEYDGGDHTIFLAEVLRVEPGAHVKPLIYFEGQWGKL